MDQCEAAKAEELATEETKPTDGPSIEWLDLVAQGNGGMIDLFGQMGR